MPRGSLASKPTWSNTFGCPITSAFLFSYPKEGSKMSENRIKLAPETVAYADTETRKLVVEFAIPGRPQIPSM